MPIDTENWMSRLSSDQRVINTCIPGSHDASAYMTGDINFSISGVTTIGLGDTINNLAGSITQTGSYTAQLNAGSRYFDMRVRTHPLGESVFPGLYMHHGPVTFQLLEKVLKQISDFSDNHPGEFLFLDFDIKDPALGKRVAKAITDILGESRLSTDFVISSQELLDLPVSTATWSTTQLTWGDLRKANKPFIVFWTGQGESWAPDRAVMREDFYDDFDKKQPTEIVQLLDGALAVWNAKSKWANGRDGREKMWLTQLVNTPKLSPVDTGGLHIYSGAPADKDLDASNVFNNWIMGKTKNDPLGVVKMDFLNAGYKRGVIEHIIKMNEREGLTFDVPALTDTISYTDYVHLKSLDGRFVQLQVETPPGICKLTLSDELTDDCWFKLRDYDYATRKPFPYSGNIGANTLDCQGNFRLCHYDTRPAPYNVGADYVLSSDVNHRNMIYWGQSWGDAKDFETMCCFDPDAMENQGQICHGSRVMIRSMIGETDNNFNKAWRAFAEGAMRVTPFAGRALAEAYAKGLDKQLFWTIGMDEKDPRIPRIFAASPGTLIADQFTIHKNRVK